MDKQKNKNTGQKKAFTVMELMLVIGMLAIIATIVIAAINPTKQLDDTRDAQRHVYTRELETAIKQAVIEGKSFSNIPSSKATARGVCKEGITTCTATGVDLATILISDYLVSLPVDPTDPDHEQTGFCVYLENGTFYEVCNKRIDSDCGTGASDCP